MQATSLGEARRPVAMSELVLYAEPICNLAYAVISHLTHVHTSPRRQAYKAVQAVVNPLCQRSVSAPSIRHALTSMQTVGNQVHRPRPHSRSHRRSLIAHTIPFQSIYYTDKYSITMDAFKKFATEKIQEQRKSTAHFGYTASIAQLTIL
jgi:hypothetical protein